jgi:hypothetical protein
MVCVQYECTAAWLLRFWHGFALRMPKHVCKGLFSHWFLRWCAKLQCTQYWDLRWACTKVPAGSMMSGEFCGSATVESVDCLHLLQLSRHCYMAPGADGIVEYHMAAAFRGWVSA